tara:strand:- start:6 stop:563 length:558 start_codon:yes stop_codon:yes gene_type:complete
MKKKKKEFIDFFPNLFVFNKNNLNFKEIKKRLDLKIFLNFIDRRAASGTNNSDMNFYFDIATSCANLSPLSNKDFNESIYPGEEIEKGFLKGFKGSFKKEFINSIEDGTIFSKISGNFELIESYPFSYGKVADQHLIFSKINNKYYHFVNHHPDFAADITARFDKKFDPSLFSFKAVEYDAKYKK